MGVEIGDGDRAYLHITISIIVNCNLNHAWQDEERRSLAGRSMRWKKKTTTTTHWQNKTRRPWIGAAAAVAPPRYRFQPPADTAVTHIKHIIKGLRCALIVARVSKDKCQALAESAYASAGQGHTGPLNNKTYSCKHMHTNIHVYTSCT